MSQQSINLYATIPHPCNYLADRDAVTAVVDPEATHSMGLYSWLMDRGFRRSGAQIYKPFCGDCNACISTRIPTQSFAPNRSQRRCWKNNQDLDIRIKPARFTEEYFNLYQRYLAVRHPGGGMDTPSPSSFDDFLFAPWSETLFVEFRLDEELLGVSVVDVTPQGYSAVYTFFEPGESKRSLGTFGVLWQIEAAKARNLPYVYLGFWIENSKKMHYKIHYQPLEAYIEKQWQTLQETPSKSQAKRGD